MQMHIKNSHNEGRLRPFYWPHELFPTPFCSDSQIFRWLLCITVYFSCLRTSHKLTDTVYISHVWTFEIKNSPFLNFIYALMCIINSFLLWSSIQTNKLSQSVSSRWWAFMSFPFLSVPESLSCDLFSVLYLGINYYAPIKL